VSGKVDTPFYTTAPSNVVIKPTATATYTVVGGTAPYTATSSDVSVASVAVANDQLSVLGVAQGSASVVVKDSVGAVISIAVAVPANSTDTNIPLYTSAPGSIVVQNSSVSSFTIAGGKAPYTVASSNSAVTTAAVTGNVLSVTGVKVGSANVVVKDALGAVVNIAVNVPSVAGQGTTALFTTSPPAVVIKNGASANYVISGGAAPYTVTSSNVAVVTSNVSGTGFTLTGVAVGTANVVVLDSTGAVVTIAVTIN